MSLDALYHAETTVLLRVARENGGTLSGREFEVYVDRTMSKHCRKVLPYVGLELGNPKVTFVGPNDERSTMHNGGWSGEPAVGPMQREAYFAEFRRSGWPDTSWLARYFLTDRGRRDFFYGGNDCWGLTAEGVAGTDHLALHQGRLDVDLTIHGHPVLGVMLQWRKIGRVPIETYYSKGDLTKLLQWTKDVRGYLQPVGLFVPFETAWSAVKEFMDCDGALPDCIEWVRDKDIPKEAFPPP